MNTDEMSRILGVAQLSDSALPTGLYSASGGIESAFSENNIRNADDILTLVASHISRRAGPYDCIILISCMRAAEDRDTIINLDDILYASTTAKCVREFSCRAGHQLLKTLSGTASHPRILDILAEYENDRMHCMYPVAFAIACTSLGLDEESALLSFLYGLSTGMIGAALRLGIIDHVEAQYIIEKLKPVIALAVRDSVKKTMSDIWQFLPEAEIYQMRHETKDTRMFVT